MKNIEFDIIPQRSALISGHATEIHALLRVRAPKKIEKPNDEGTPLNLALVLDRSGSMRGAPLDEAKRCAMFIVDRLGPKDSLSVVAYDDRVRVVLPAGPITSKEHAKSMIAQLTAGGATALFEGWEQGALQALKQADSQAMTRVLLLSDGCANHGLTDTAQIGKCVSDMFELGVSTSTYGLGHRFNEELMVDMAQAGGGQSYYGESSEDLMDLFEEEFSLLSSLCARSLTLTLSTPAGISVELLNPYKRLSDCSWQLPDLAFDAEAWALVKLTVPDALPHEIGRADIEALRAFVRFAEVDAAQSSFVSASLYLPRVAPDAWAGIVEDEQVMARLQELQVAQLQREARDAARYGDWAAVDAIIQRAETAAGDNRWVAESLSRIKRYAKRRDRDRMSKEAMYSSRRMENRLAAKGENAGAYVVEEQVDMPVFLRRKPEQGKRLR